MRIAAAALWREKARLQLADVVAGIECEYDVLFLPGGHGTCADFVDNSNVGAHPARAVSPHVQ